MRWRGWSLEDSEVYTVTEIGGAETAKEIWDEFKKFHEETNVPWKAFRAFQEMISRRYVEGSSAMEYKLHFQIDRAKLSDFKVEVSEEILEMLMLACIPCDSDILNIMVHQSLSRWNDTGEISLDAVVDRLRRAEMMYKSCQRRQPEISTVQPRMWCTFHMKRTHNTEDCRALARLSRV